jgi:PilZ domain-containing protein
METKKTLCQFCQSPFVTQIQPESLLDKLATLISLRPFRCESCKKRFRVKQQAGQSSSGPEQRRKSVRVSVQIPVTFESNEVSGEGILTDMSLNGCSLESKQSLRSGLVIKLNLPAGKGQKSGSTVQQLATVMWINGQRAGLQFLAYSFQERNALTHTVTQSVKIYAR